MRFTKVEEHPIPTTTEECKKQYRRLVQNLAGDWVRSEEEWEDPALNEKDEEWFHPDAVHDRCEEVIAEYGDMKALRIHHPFGTGDVMIWDRGTGQGIRIPDDEFNFHSFKNLMAELIEEMGDCRDAEVKDNGVMPSGSHKMTCRGCNKSWWVG